MRQAVENGDYASSSEVIRDWSLKRSLRSHGVDALRQLWQEARQDTGPGQPAEDVLNRLDRSIRLAGAAR